MPLPLILGAAAATAGAVGVGGAVHGAVKMKKANDTMKLSKSEHEANLKRFEEKSNETTQLMDRIGKKELEILSSFSKFSAIFERIQNKPEFKDYKIGKVEIPSCDIEELKQVYIGAGVLLGGLGGAVAGAAGGFAAAGATTAAVMALGTASTGTAIASLSGVAATNATLAALGGGAIAAGGGGMALGTAVLGAATVGVGILVGGIIFSITGSSLSKKAHEAQEQMQKAQAEINAICAYFNILTESSKKFENTLNDVDSIYRRHLEQMGNLVVVNGKTNWEEYTDGEQKMIENTVLLVSLLYKMCKTKLVLQAEEGKKFNEVNEEGVGQIVQDARDFLDETGLAALA